MLGCPYELFNDHMTSYMGHLPTFDIPEAVRRLLSQVNSQTTKPQTAGGPVCLAGALC